MTQSRRDLLKCAAIAAFAPTAALQAAASQPGREPSPNDYALLYDSTRCIGCKACMAACKREGGLPSKCSDGCDLHDSPLDLSGNTRTVIRTAEGPDGPVHLKAQCMHCVHPACVSVCMIGALHKSKGGIVAYDPSLCLGCRYCQVACPFNVPKFQWDTATPLIVKCELCKDRIAAGLEPACTEACPRQTVVFGGRTALLEEAERRIDGEPDRYIDHIYGEHDLGGTQVMVLSAVPFATLALPDLGNEPQTLLAETVQQGIYKGFVLPVVAYAALASAVWRSRRAGTEAPGSGRPTPTPTPTRPSAPRPTSPGQLGEGGMA